jgi:hypothetical protein
VARKVQLRRRRRRKEEESIPSFILHSFIPSFFFFCVVLDYRNYCCCSQKAKYNKKTKKAIDFCGFPLPEVCLSLVFKKLYSTLKH